MNKADLVNAVAERTGVTKATASMVVDALFNASDGIIVSTLRQGEDVLISGFGKFSVKERAARTGRNPRTGEQITIPASRSPDFKAGKGLKDAL